MSYCSFCIKETTFIEFLILFQKSEVKSSNTVNNSKRPKSIKKESSHLAASGN